MSVGGRRRDGGGKKEGRGRGGGAFWCGGRGWEGREGGDRRTAKAEMGLGSACGCLRANLVFLLEGSAFGSRSLEVKLVKCFTQRIINFRGFCRVLQLLGHGFWVALLAQDNTLLEWIHDSFRLLRSI